MGTGDEVEEVVSNGSRRRVGRKRRSIWKRRQFWIAVAAILIAVMMVLWLISSLGAHKDAD